MHSGKVHSWKINKWVMAGKNDFPSSDHSPVGFDLIAVNRPDKGIFIHGQLGGKSGNQLNRVKLCLILKSNGAGRINGKAGRLDKRGGNPQFFGRKRFFFQGFGILGINICVGYFKITINLLFPDEAAVCGNGIFICLRVLAGFFLSTILDQAMV